MWEADELKRFQVKEGFISEKGLGSHGEELSTVSLPI